MVLLNSLSFTYTFEHDDDTVFFSYFQPYTYSDLRDYLYSVSKRCSSDFLKANYKCQKLCNTLEGNACHLITITDNIMNENQAMQINPSTGLPQKPVIFLTARVHPGEANASYMVQGVIDYLMN